MTTLVNIVSRKAISYYNQFIYEAILKTAVTDLDLQFSVRSSPFPTMYKTI